MSVCAKTVGGSQKGAVKDTKQMVKFILVGVLAVASGIAAYIYRDDQLIVDLLTIPCSPASSAISPTGPAY